MTDLFGEAIFRLSISIFCMLLLCCVDWLPKCTTCVWLNSFDSASFLRYQFVVQFISNSWYIRHSTWIDLRKLKIIRTWKRRKNAPKKCNQQPISTQSQTTQLHLPSEFESCFVYKVLSARINETSTLLTMSSVDRCSSFHKHFCFITAQTTWLVH